MVVRVGCEGALDSHSRRGGLVSGEFVVVSVLGLLVSITLQTVAKANVLEAL